jgi:hypothetical protein
MALRIEVMDILLAQSYMKLPNEGIPHGCDNLDWAYAPRIVMGDNPTQANLPSYYTGAVYPTYPRITTWFLVCREAGSMPTVNSRVNIQSIQLYVKSKVTGLWTLLDDSLVPGGADYQEQVPPSIMVGTGESQAWKPRIEADGTISLRPPEQFFSQGWGVMQTLDVADIGGVYIQVSHRVITDDQTKPDTRATDKWIVNIGADYWAADGSVPMATIACMDGRFLKSCTDWRTSMAIC